MSCKYVCESLGLRVEVEDAPIVLSAHRALLEFAFRALFQCVIENRAGLGANDLILKVRSTGSNGDLVAMFALRGKSLEVEGILPEPVDNGVPNQGRIGVFLAKEIINLHHGEIHGGPGMEGTEILFCIRNW